VTVQPVGEVELISRHRHGTDIPVQESGYGTVLSVYIYRLFCLDYRLLDFFVRCTDFFVWIGRRGKWFIPSPPPPHTPWPGPTGS
jgi:hypothetical protein